MKKITCVGFHETGAGVIDNLFRECDNVAQGAYEAEVRFLHDPDGISDLEYHLVENPHRLSSGLAIKRFIRYAEGQRRQVGKVYGRDWVKDARVFAESLALSKYNGYTQADLTLLSDFQQMELFAKKAFNRLKPGRFRHPVWYNYLPWIETYYSRMSEEDFLAKVNAFVELFCRRVNPEGKEFLMLDQFVGANNPTRYLRYVSDMKVFVVDRDPRDLFIHLVERKDKVLPKDPEQFCTVYRGIRKTTGEDPENVMRIRFEDMIYDYDRSVESAFHFVGIDASHHVFPGRYFNRTESKKGTLLWKTHPQYESAVTTIERLLPDFLYPFPETD